MRKIELFLIGTVTVLLAIVLPTFSKGNIMDFGNASDIVSALCNVAMAGAAVYAAINAKQWFSQKSHTKGFDKAEEILSRIDSYYRNRNNYLSELHLTSEFFEAVNSRLTVADPILLDKYDKLSKEHSDNIVLIDKLSEELLLIERWSITVINIELINSVIKPLRELNISASNAYNGCYSCVYNYNYMHKDDFENSFNYLKTQYTEFLKDLHTLETCYDKFKRNKFANFFRVN